MASARFVRASRANALVRDLVVNLSDGQLVVERTDGADLVRVSLDLDEQYHLHEQAPERPAPPRPESRPEPELREPEPPVRPGGRAGYGGFGVGAWPGSAWRPYTATSPWNALVLPSTSVHPRSAAIVANILRLGRPSTLVAGVSTSKIKDYAHPTYWAQPTDPLVTIKSTNPANNPVSGIQIRVPVGALPASGEDGHMCIVQPNGDEIDLWRARPVSNGVLVFENGSRTHVEWTGLGARATASQMALMAGVIRAEELIEGAINHALFGVIKAGGTVAAGATPDGAAPGFPVQRGTDGAAYCYPSAPRGDSKISGPNQPWMGIRLRLRYTDAEIAALNVPAWKKTIVRALAHYGTYMCDTGGPGFGFQFQSGATYTSFGLPDPLVGFAKANGIREGSGDWAGTFPFDVASGIDWNRLEVIAPPAQG